ncbi:MAG TPA: DUF1761 domain-containing protein [Candidatus Saccharimonadales bacterium]|nr:DUF1761 domain-containing protein [Candidatus Saccharimonadales bacterium]
MTGLDVNVWGVLLCGVASLVVGAVYYSDAVFGKDWKKLSKIDVKQYQKDFPKLLPVLFIGALLTGYLVGIIDCFYEKFYVASWMQSSLAAAFIAWVLIATSMTVHAVLDQKPSKLMLISVGNRFFTLLAMGLILGWLHP